MSIVQTADRVHESIAEVNKPYRLSPPMTDQQRVEEPAFTTVQSVKDELAAWLAKGGLYTLEVVRLLDQAELDHVKYGQVMMLQIRSYRTGRWILFSPPKASLRSMEGWYSFVREELNWTGSIRWLVGSPGEDSIEQRIEQSEAKLAGFRASIAAGRAVAQAFRQSILDDAEEQMFQFQQANSWPCTLAPEPTLKRQLEDRLELVRDLYSRICELIEDESLPLRLAQEELEFLRKKLSKEQSALRRAGGPHGRRFHSPPPTK